MTVSFIALSTILYTGRALLENLIERRAEQKKAKLASESKHQGMRYVDFKKAKHIKVLNDITIALSISLLFGYLIFSTTPLASDSAPKKWVDLSTALRRKYFQL